MSVESDAEIREILGLDRVAVVGCSTTPGEAAHDVPRFLQRTGYEVVPVNANAEAVLGEPAADSLTDLNQPVDIVDVFRPNDEVPGIVEQALDLPGLSAIWLQLGISHRAAAERAEEAEVPIVQDACMSREHQRLGLDTYPSHSSNDR